MLSESSHYIWALKQVIMALFVDSFVWCCNDSNIITLIDRIREQQIMSNNILFCVEIP